MDDKLKFVNCDLKIKATDTVDKNIQKIIKEISRRK